MMFAFSSLHLARAALIVGRSQGGYFIINGSEKVLIAQERMAANTVYVFAKAAPSAVTHLAEIRSAVEKGGKTISTMQVKIFKPSSADHTATGGRVIRTTLPYIRSDIPVVVVFRALGIISDRDILDHIVYERNDNELVEMMKPSIEEAFPIDDQDVS